MLMLILMHLVMLFWVMNPQQRCFKAKVKNLNEPKQVMPKSQDLSKSLEIIKVPSGTVVVTHLFLNNLNKLETRPPGDSQNQI